MADAAEVTPWSSPDEIVVLLGSGLGGAFLGHWLLKWYQASDESHTDHVFVGVVGLVLLLLIYACVTRYRQSPSTPS